MKRGLGVLISAVVLAACGSTASTPPSPSSAAPSASPSPSPSPSVAPASSAGYFAIWSGDPPQRLMLVDSHGTVRASTSWASNRSRFRDPPAATGPGTGDSDLMPYFSSSRTRLYYLEGDAQVRYLTLDGQSGLAKSLPVGSLQRAGFAVSPDDTTIAVSLIDYSVTPHRITVYTENLADSGNHHVLYTSTTRFAWPIGFVADQVLMAVGPTGTQSGSGDPYNAQYGYALLDRSGNVVRRLCAPASSGTSEYGTAHGPIDPDGAVCDPGSGRVLQTWSGGQVRLYDKACGSEMAAEYAPDRRHLLCTEVSSTATTLDMHVVDSSGHVLVSHRESPSDSSGTRFSWLDNDHVLIGVDLVDIHTGAATPLARPSSVMWRVPGDLYLAS